MSMMNRVSKEKCRISPAGGLGVSPNFFLISPKIGGQRGLKWK